MSINWLLAEVDEIITVLTTADNVKILGKLPLFVLEDLDKMPTQKLTDGDMSAIMVKLNNYNWKLMKTMLL